MEPFLFKYNCPESCENAKPLRSFKPIITGIALLRIKLYTLPNWEELHFIRKVILINFLSKLSAQNEKHILLPTCVKHLFFHT